MSAIEQPWLHDLVTVLCAPTVVLSERGGQIRDGAGAQGVLHADVRVLSRALLTVGGAEPVPIGGGTGGAGSVRFTVVPRTLGDDDTAEPTVWIDRERTVTPGAVSERIQLVSYADSGVDTELVLSVAADLASLDEVKGARNRPPVPLALAGEQLTWGDGELAVTLSAPGGELAGDGLTGDGLAGGGLVRWRVRLDGRGVAEVGWRLAVTDPGAAVIAAPRPARPLVRVSADDPRLAELVGHALADADSLRMAVPDRPDDVFLAAGAPWFCTLFGRDSIWAARLLLPFGWQLAASTLRALAAFQGRRLDPDTAEAPGKIPHELRRGGSLYYATIDATPLWICLLHDAWRWGMPAAQVRPLLPALRAALEWMPRYGDSDGDGLLEYIDQSGHGLSNQGWKDSGDSVRFADGRIAEAPVALCEVQGYAYEAAMDGAELLSAFGEPDAGRWRDWAAGLAEAFRVAFWLPDGYPALALDAGKRPVDSLTSNIGHLLGTGLLTKDEEALVAAHLAGPDMSSGFGLRTMSAGNAAYNPLSYHCGSVWSHDTAIAISGLFRSGHGDVAARLADGLLSAAAAFGWRLPELFSGEDRGPLPYPAACRPQAWSAAAAGALTQALLGLDVDVPAGLVRIQPPSVPVGGAGRRVRIDGLVAGQETFTAGVDEAGHGYLEGCSLRRD
jgi:N-terminal domain of (some) glycogen debranching enzymes/Amylo-alpha-1,6-glucosidase